MADFWETPVLSTAWSNPEQTQLDRSMPVPRPFYPGVFFSQINGFSLLTHFDLSTLCTHDSVGSLFTGVCIGASRLPTMLLSSVFYNSTAMCLFFLICLFYFSYRFCILKKKIFIFFFVFPLCHWSLLIFVWYFLLPPIVLDHYYFRTPNLHKCMQCIHRLTHINYILVFCILSSSK